MTVDERLERIERLLVISQKNVLTTEEVALYMGLSPSRINAMASNRELPFYRRKDGKLRYFKKDEIENVMLQQRVPSNDEIDREAATRMVLGQGRKRIFQT